MDYKKILEKLRALSDFQKRIIMWSIVAVLAVILGYLWVQGLAKSVSEINQQISKSLSQTSSPSN